MSADKYHCGRCRMSFRVRDEFMGQSEISRCSEPGCGMRMATGTTYDGAVKVYVLRTTVEAMRESVA